jgi:hypothetical protein
LHGGGIFVKKFVCRWIIYYVDNALLWCVVGLRVFVVCVVRVEGVRTSKKKKTSMTDVES